MPDKPELLPCPFCGQMPEVEREFDYVSIGCDNPNCKMDNVDVFCQDQDNDLISAIAAWNTRAAPRWIPVTERLPEKVGDYLVKIADNLHQNRSIKILPYFHSRGWMGESKQCPVTHWMPLPQPPEVK